VIFARSARGRRVSQAAKSHAANLRFRSEILALLSPAHPGDNCKVVRLVVSEAQFRRLFPAGAGIADLRQL
jgi:hypothetical protein